MCLAALEFSREVGDAFRRLIKVLEGVVQRLARVLNPRVEPHSQLLALHLLSESPDCAQYPVEGPGAVGWGGSRKGFSSSGIEGAAHNRLSDVQLARDRSLRQARVGRGKSCGPHLLLSISDDPFEWSQGIKEFPCSAKAAGGIADVVGGDCLSHFVS